MGLESFPLFLPTVFVHVHYDSEYKTVLREKNIYSTHHLNFSCMHVYYDKKKIELLIF